MLLLFWQVHKERCCSCALETSADYPPMIALQVVRASLRFHIRECMGSCFPPPPPPPMFKSLDLVGIDGNFKNERETMM